MSTKRRCAYCGCYFDAVSSRHKHCSRKCFKRNYNLKQKQSIEPPTLVCPVCKKIIKLKFFPNKKDNIKKFKHITCKKCGYNFSSNLKYAEEEEKKQKEYTELFFGYIFPLSE